MLRRTALATVLASLLLGCATDGGDPDTDRAAKADGPLVGHVIEFALEPDALDHARMEKVGKRIEEITAAETMQIRVEKTDEGGTVVVAEAWGRTAITGDAITKDLRATFPELTNAVIAVKAASGEPPSARLPEIEIDEDEEPEAIKARVLKDLRARGVEGDVDVVVDERDDGKREIRVEVKHEEKHVDAPLAAP